MMSLHYQQYVILLHALCACGTQSDESDDIRDQMDEHWYRMTLDELEAIECLSIALQVEGESTFRAVP